MRRATEIGSRAALMAFRFAACISPLVPLPVISVCRATMRRSSEALGNQRLEARAGIHAREEFHLPIGRGRARARRPERHVGDHDIARHHRGQNVGEGHGLGDPAEGGGQAVEKAGPGSLGATRESRPEEGRSRRSPASRRGSASCPLVPAKVTKASWRCCHSG